MSSFSLNARESHFEVEKTAGDQNPRYFQVALSNSVVTASQVIVLVLSLTMEAVRYFQVALSCCEMSHASHVMALLLGLQESLLAVTSRWRYRSR